MRKHKNPAVSQESIHFFGCLERYLCLFKDLENARTRISHLQSLFEKGLERNENLIQRDTEDQTGGGGGGSTEDNCEDVSI